VSFTKNKKTALAKPSRWDLLGLDAPETMTRNLHPGECFQGKTDQRVWGIIPQAPGRVAEGIPFRGLYRDIPPNGLGS